MAAFIGVSSTFDAKAADTMGPNQSRHRVATANRYCQDLWRCRRNGSCDWYRVCTRPCPDGYSCSPLYGAYGPYGLSLIHISEPTRQAEISYAVFCLKKKKK